MKKLLLLAAAACSIGSASASSFPALDVFSHEYTQESTSLAPFTSWASEYTVNSAFSDWFDSDWVVLTFNSGDTYVMSCSSFTETSLKADTGLVTPKITLPAEGGLLSFTTINWNPQYSGRNNPLEIYVSTEGNQKENFTDANLLKSYRIKADSQSTGPTVTTYEVSLADYAGKDVYIAFVNKGIYSGALGLNKFYISKYMAELDVTSPSLYTVEGEYGIDCTAKLRTPASCRGFQAELIIDGEVKSVYNTTRELSTAYYTYNFVFPDKIALSLNQSVPYTVKLTPNYEGAESIYVEGNVACAEGFPAVVVEEEGTGVGCGFCPLGQAFLSYFQDTYPDQFIGIAVHGGPYASGVMTAPNYSTEFLNAYNKRGGYPFCTLNRAVSPVPHYLSSIEPEVLSRMQQNVALRVNINHTYYYTDDNKISVAFTPQACVDLSNAHYQAAVVLLADDLCGAEGNAYWAQYNNYSGMSDSRLSSFGITADNMEALRPYYEVYTKAEGIIKGCKFDHVAMGCWPDWRGNGCPLASDIKKHDDQYYTITFDVPMQTAVDQFGVQDITKTSVAVLIFDSVSGEIVTAKKMKYADFEQFSSVEEVNGNAAAMSAQRSGDLIVVKGTPGTVAEMYAIDGTLLGKKVLTSGEDTIAPLGYHGIVIVRLTNGNDSYYNKIVM